MTDSHDIADALCLAADELDQQAAAHPANQLDPKNFGAAHAAKMQIVNDARWLRSKGRMMRVALIEAGIPHPADG